MSEADQFNQAFGEHTGVSGSCRADINRIKNNDPDFTKLVLETFDAAEFTDLAWQLLGRYIANNNHLEKIDLEVCNLTNEKMVLLFKELVKSSICKLDIRDNPFGIGVRSMVPFLKNSPNLSILDLSRNDINTEYFEVLISALNGKSLEKLYLQKCNITDLSALDSYTLPDLLRLNLKGNDIGREGCAALSNLLRKEGSKLKYLNLTNNGMGDEEAELLAAALKHNTKLQTLDLSGNNITEKGYKAFLKVLVDISSIESTYNSNHSLFKIELPRAATTAITHMNSALQLNILHHSSRQSSRHDAGRAKVIDYQLSSWKRKGLCRLQGIEYSSIGNLFADIEPVTLLPRILALIGEKHGRSEFYTTLIPTVPELMSCVDTSGMMKDLIVKNASQAATLRQQVTALTDENEHLSRRLAARESGGSQQTTNIGSTAASGKKRQRS